MVAAEGKKEKVSFASVFLAGEDKSCSDKQSGMVARKEEIGRLSALLQDMGITLDSLVRASPGNWKVREYLQEIAYQIGGDSEAVEKLLKTKTIPPGVSVEKEAAGLGNLERYWPYLVVITLIIHYNLTHLFPYIVPRKRRG